MNATGSRLSGPIEAQLARVVELVNGDRAEAALGLCENIVAVHPHHPAALQLLAVLCLQHGEVARAREAIGASLQGRPDHGPSWLIAGDAARAAGDLSSALRHHRRASALMPERADAAYALAQTLRDGAALAEAEAGFARTVELAPAHAPAWFALALVRQDRRDLDGAAAALRQLLQVAPPRAEVEVNLAIVLQEAGKIDAAMRAYGRAYRLSDDCFGRIAHALAASPCGRLWLDLDALREQLRTMPA